MNLYALTLLLALHCLCLAGNEQAVQSIAVVEHEPTNITSLQAANASWPMTTQKTLIRVTRLNRHRRDTLDINHDYEKIGEEIWGMAKKVAITVIVVVSLCIVGCIVCTVFLCMKCCCGLGSSQGKRNQAPVTIHVPQPVYIHSTTPQYQPQFYQQQQSPAPVWTPETQPMLPQPSAPMHPTDEYAMERPPPYEQICMSK